MKKILSALIISISLLASVSAELFPFPVEKINNDFVRKYYSTGIRYAVTTYDKSLETRICELCLDYKTINISNVADISNFNENDKNAKDRYDDVTTLLSEYEFFELDHNGTIEVYFYEGQEKRLKVLIARNKREW